MTQPLVSLISINRNNANGLRKTLASAAEQTFRDFEHIVIDGGSTDESLTAIREFESGIEFWCSERDAGIYSAMNKGAARANGDFLLFLNSGDHLLDADSLRFAAMHLSEHDLCYFDLEIRESETNSAAHSRVIRYPDVLRFSHFLISSLPHPACLIRRSLFARFGGYDESLKICADWKAFILWVCKHNCTYLHVPQVLSVFYADGLSSRSESQRLIKAERKEVIGAEFAAFSQDALDALEAREALTQVAALRRSRVVRLLQASSLIWKF